MSIPYEKLNQLLDRAITHMSNTLEMAEEFINMFKNQEPNHDVKVNGDYVKLCGPVSPSYMIEKHSGVIKIAKKDAANVDNMPGIMKFIKEGVYMVIDDAIAHKFNCGLCDEIHTATLAISSIHDDQVYYIHESFVQLTNEKGD